MSKLNPLKRPMEITAEYLAAQKPVKKLQTNETNNNLMAVDANKAAQMTFRTVNFVHMHSCIHRDSWRCATKWLAACTGGASANSAAAPRYGGASRAKYRLGPYYGRRGFGAPNGPHDVYHYERRR